MRPHLLVLTFALFLGLSSTAQAAHPRTAAPATTAGVFGGKAFTRGMFGPGTVASTPAGARTRVIDGRDGSTFAGGPCTADARASMPDGEGHDHLDISQHRFACRMEQVAFLSLKEELGDREDVILGEMDIKAGIAAVAVTYPESGVIFFDVSSPGQPKFLSWLRVEECEGAIIDVDCGAFVDLSPDGKVAFLSTQNISTIPGAVPPALPPTVIPGVYAIDASNPREPAISDFYPVANLGGIHTTRSHMVPGKGLYAFTNTLGTQGLVNNGVDILRVDTSSGSPFFEFVGQLTHDEIHDTFIQDDPLTGKTLLYIATGFESGFYVYDMTDPESPSLLAEWDLTPQCAQDWYSHTIDVTTKNGRRYVTMPTEMINSFGDQDEEDQAENCGKLAGNGDVPGVLWIVDATDLGKLGPAAAEGDDDEQALAAASKAALVATWSNPADRAGGNLTFSPHNQQIVGDKIYLSHYHGGVYVLDASAAFAGKKERPKEIGFIVPHGAETRPIYEPTIAPLVIPFFSTFPAVRPDIWDAYHYEGITYAADMRGGFYAFKETAPAAARKPALRITRVGTARKSSCSGRDRLLARVAGDGVSRVRFYAGRKKIGTDGKAPFERRIRRSQLGRGRTLTAKVSVADGKTITLKRRVKRC